MGAYVHGYSDLEASRLVDQANTLTNLLHNDTQFPAGSLVLEAGCGTGAQTIILAKQSPQAHITSIDLSRESLKRAEASIKKENISNVAFMLANIFELPFYKERFDHVFVCFVLEHLKRPLEALQELKSVLKPGGSVTVIEGDHGSYFCFPESYEASLAVNCLVALQSRLGGNALIGRQIYPLLNQAGYKDVSVSPRMVYADASRPHLVEGFTKKTFISMVEGVKEQSIELNLIDETTWNKGIADLYRTAESDGTFCYTFFKGIGYK